MTLLSLGKQSAIYGFGHVLTRLANFLLLPLLTNSLTPSDYGIISIIYIFIGFTMTFYRYGMDSALMKFYIEENNPKSYFSSILFLQIITSLIFSLILFLSRGYIEPMLINNGEKIFITYIAIIIFCDIVWNLIILTLRASEKPLQFVAYNVFNVVMTLGFTIYLVNIKEMGAEGVLIGNLIASMIMVVLSSLLLIKQFSISSIRFSIMAKIIRFGMPFLPAAIFTMIMEGADRFILKYMTNEATVGIYSASYKLGIFGLLIVMAFNMGWTPYFLKHNKDNDCNTHYSTISSLLLGFYGFIGILLTILIPQVQNISLYGYTLIGAEYFSGLKIVPIILMSYYFLGIYILMLPRVYKHGETTKIPYFRMVGALSNVILNIILIPRFGIMGSAYATLVSFAIMSYYIFNVGNRMEYVQYNLKAWFFPLMIWIGVIILTILESNYLMTSSIIVLYPIIWYKLIITNAEREQLLGAIK